MAVEMTFDEVLAQTGTTAKTKGLLSMVGRVVRFSAFAVEEKGRKNKREVLTATAESNGQSSKVRIPDRYAKRIREVMDKRGPIVLTAKVERGERGPMLKPLAPGTNGGTVKPSKRQKPAPPEAAG